MKAKRIMNEDCVFLYWTCSNCNSLVLEHDNFCSNCGADFRQNEEGEEKTMTEIDGYTTPNMPVKENGEWLIISFKDGEYAKYKPDEYTDYYYDKKCFIVIRDKQWIGIYNIDEIKYVEVVQNESNIS